MIKRAVWLVPAVVIAVLALPAVAFAHLERPSYWPDPGPDFTISPPAGGKVPTPRSLESAVWRGGRGDVLVVCQGRKGWKSLQYLRESVYEARKWGYRLRPSQSKTKLSRYEAYRLLAINAALARKCHYDSVQRSGMRATTTGS